LIRLTGPTRSPKNTCPVAVAARGPENELSDEIAFGGRNVDRAALRRKGANVVSWTRRPLILSEAALYGAQNDMLAAIVRDFLLPF
jgi:hypothetical protein